MAAANLWLIKYYTLLQKLTLNLIADYMVQVSSSVDELPYLAGMPQCHKD
jgi:hypothetical protein